MDVVPVLQREEGGLVEGGDQAKGFSGTKCRWMTRCHSRPYDRQVNGYTGRAQRGEMQGHRPPKRGFREVWPVLIAPPRTSKVKSGTGMSMFPSSAHIANAGSFHLLPACTIARVG